MDRKRNHYKNSYLKNMQWKALIGSTNDSREQQINRQRKEAFIPPWSVLFPNNVRYSIPRIHFRFVHRTACGIWLLWRNSRQPVNLKKPICGAACAQPRGRTKVLRVVLSDRTCVSRRVLPRTYASLKTTTSKPNIYLTFANIDNKT